MPKRRTHQTPCKGRRSTTTTWEGGALGGEGGRKEPATTINAGASSWWGSFTQCGGTPRMMAGNAWWRRWRSRLQHRLISHSRSQPWMSSSPPRASLLAANSCCTQTRRSLRNFSPRHSKHSILKPEWRLWWPFRWQGILRGQVSDEATRDLPKFVTFLEKRVKVFCAHYLLYISININILLLMFG